MNANVLPGVSQAQDGSPVFAEPWQAQAVAMVLSLHQRGLYTWPEWARALAEQIASAQAHGDVDRGDTYYRHWLTALESIVTGKGAATRDELTQTQQAWDRAADRTPHGQPIQLQPSDFER